MSSVLDTINSFSSTLSSELAQAVKDQDEATVEAFEDIGAKLATARTHFIDTLNTIEDTFNADVKKVVDARSRSMKDNGAALDMAFKDIVKIIDEVKARYA